MYYQVKNIPYDLIMVQKMKKTIFIILTVFIAGFATGQNNAPPETVPLEVYGQRIFSEFPSEIRETGFHIPDTYVLGIEDELIINVWGAFEEEYRKTIEYDGAIFIPYIGKVHLEGLSLSDAKELIRTKLFGRYKNISVSVTTGKLRTLEIFVLGEVKKPGSYLISPLTSILEVLAMAGGATDKGSLRHIKITKKSDGSAKYCDLYPMFMSGEPPPEIQFSQGDMVFVPLAESLAGIKGAVRRPAIYEIAGPATLKDLMELAGGALPNADFSRVQVERTDKSRGRIFIDIDCNKSGNFAINNFDTVNIFPLPEQPFYRVSMEGAVRRPGTYGWKEGLKLSDLLREEELLPYALRDKGEVIRTEPDGGKKIIIMYPAKIFAGEKEYDIPLVPQDRILVYSQERPEKRVVIQGQVYYPGEYVVVRGDRLSDLVKRAGGFTRHAYLPGIVFMRETIRAEKEKQLATFVKEKEVMLKQEETQAESAEEKKLLNQGNMLLQQLKATEIKGRIPLYISDEKYAGRESDIFLEDGDNIYVPVEPVSVAVIGEVNLPGNIVFKKNSGFNYYIEKSGGFAKNADRRNVFVAKVNGTATSDVGNIGTGDTIVIPFEVKERKGTLLKDIAQMFYNISLGLSVY